ncbi:MAG TPA: nucleotidyltransferase [bacterium]|nr:nucleotidyltransferase [bacterium]
MNPISVQRPILKAFCKKNGIRKLSVFGSILRDDFQEGSDIDILVEFNPDKRIGFLSMARMEMELTQLFNRKVDLRTPAELSRYFREDVLNEAQVQYESE